MGKVFLFQPRWLEHTSEYEKKQAFQQIVRDLACDLAGPKGEAFVRPEYSLSAANCPMRAKSFKCSEINWQGQHRPQSSRHMSGQRA